MNTLIAKGWDDYKLLDTGDGKRLEQFGSTTIVRPDPNILWPASHPGEQWASADAFYSGGEKQWHLPEGLEEGWKIRWGQVVAKVRPTPFRHLGVFPEQSAHWEWLQSVVAHSSVRPRVLNLFAYTGIASIVLAQAGAEVCHVDASSGSVQWAKENARLSGLPEDAVRWIVDDVRKFMKREIRRGKQYDLIIMDPPVFGRGPKGEIWRLEEGLSELASLSYQLLSGKPLGILVNFYATSLYPHSVLRLFSDQLHTLLPTLEAGELLLKEEFSEKTLPTGYYLRS